MVHRFPRSPPLSPLRICFFLFILFHKRPCPPLSAPPLPLSTVFRRPFPVFGTSTCVPTSPNNPSPSTPNPTHEACRVVLSFHKKKTKKKSKRKFAAILVLSPRLCRCEAHASSRRPWPSIGGRLQPSLLYFSGQKSAYRIGLANHRRYPTTNKALFRSGSTIDRRWRGNTRT